MRLDEDDVRSMVRLVGEVAAMPGGHAEKKRFVMEGICRLVQADAWAWALSCAPHPEKPQIYISIVNGGFTGPQFTKLLEAVEHPEMIALTSAFFSEMLEKQKQITRMQNQMINLEAFQKSDVGAVWKAADLGSIIFSARPLDQLSSSTIAIYRRFGREEFTARDSRIAHILLTEVAWLHEQGWPEDRGASVPTLSRRQRLTLNLLTQGHSRKTIAAEMKISMNTVQGYVKDIYRHFRVNSQAELMKRFFQGNEQDVK